ncbi:MAG: hypothetical protein ACREQ4_03555, partial [Candidatus Binataceae bacterium]
LPNTPLDLPPGVIATGLDASGTTLVAALLLSLALEGASWTNLYLAALMLFINILEWTGVIPNPIDVLIQQFAGRSRGQATVEVIRRLSGERNAAARLYSVLLSRLLTDDDIVISSSDPAEQTILGGAAAQFAANLEGQGIGAPRAREILATVLAPAFQAGGEMPPELGQQTDPDLVAQIPAEAIDVYNEGIQHALKLHKDPCGAVNYAERYMYLHTPVRYLMQIRIGPEPIPPVRGGKVPQGNFDIPLSTIKANIDGKFDALTEAVATAAAVAPQLASIASELASIRDGLAGIQAGEKPAAPVDLAPITQALDATYQAVDHGFGASIAALTTDLAGVVAALNAIEAQLAQANAQAKAALSDFDQCVCQPLRAMVTADPNIQAQINALAQWLVEPDSTVAQAVQLVTS